MSKSSTQAHLPHRVRKPGGLSTMTKRQLEYYMGAKLLEVGVDPNSTDIVYRWWKNEEGNDVVYTYSAYWGDSKDKLLAKEQADSQ